MRINQAKIAEDLGLSVITVSRALRNHPDLAEATKVRILDKARELGYTRLRAAKANDASHSVFTIAKGILSHNNFELDLNDWPELLDLLKEFSKHGPSRLRIAALISRMAMVWIFMPASRWVEDTGAGARAQATVPGRASRDRVRRIPSLKGMS